MIKTESDSILVDIWNRITWFFKFVNLFEPVRKCCDYFAIKIVKGNKKDINNEIFTYDGREEVFRPKRTLNEEEEVEFKKYCKYRYNFIDVGTVLCAICSIIISILIYTYSDFCGKSIFVVAFIVIQWRILEIVSRHTQTALFESDGGGNSVHVRNVTRSIILLFHNIFEFVFLFSSLQIITSIWAGINIKEQITYFDYIKGSFLSFLTFSDINHEIMGSVRGIQSIVSVEIVVGYWIELIALARFVGVLPNMLTQIKTDDKNKKE